MSKIVRTITYHGEEKRMIDQIRRSLADGTHHFSNMEITVKTITQDEVPYPLVGEKTRMDSEWQAGPPVSDHADK